MIGVEEEYFLVDSQTRMPEPAGARVARLASATLGDLVCGEFTQYQIEVKTPPCADATQLREQLLRLRSAAAAAAAAEGLQIYASGTPVVDGCAPGASRGPSALPCRCPAVPRDARGFRDLRPACSRPPP